MSEPKRGSEPCPRRRIMWSKMVAMAALVIPHAVLSSPHGDSHRKYHPSPKSTKNPSSVSRRFTS